MIFFMINRYYIITKCCFYENIVYVKVLNVIIFFSSSSLKKKLVLNLNQNHIYLLMNIYEYMSIELRKHFSTKKSINTVLNMSLCSNHAVVWLKRNIASHMDLVNG